LAPAIDAYNATRLGVGYRAPQTAAGLGGLNDRYDENGNPIVGP
jgi:hypothetical protein